MSLNEPFFSRFAVGSIVFVSTLRSQFVLLKDSPLLRLALVKLVVTITRSRAGRGR
jgi:hypothetical protein